MGGYLRKRSNDDASGYFQIILPAFIVFLRLQYCRANIAFNMVGEYVHVFRQISILFILYQKKLTLFDEPNISCFFLTNEIQVFFGTRIIAISIST